MAVGHSCAQAATPADADRFVNAINAEVRDYYAEITAAQWVSETYINADTELLVSKANERALSRLSTNVEKAKEYGGIPGLSPATARSIGLLKLQTPMPAPANPAKIAELTQIASRLNAAYGAGKSCTDESRPETCRNLDQLSRTMADDRDWDKDLDAWLSWHNVARGMRKDYVRFTELVNEGAREMGYGNAGDMWRAAYDMDAADFRKETDRLWKQVKPLYQELQCYARTKLDQRYPGKMPKDGTIPAHITGNMWAQDWVALYPLLQPFPGVSNLDVDAALKKEGYTPEKMTRRAEDFYTSIGFPALPASFYERSQLNRPRDRDVVCHASAWDMNLTGDVRIKMCININEEDFRTIYHELGHVYYYLAYNNLPPLFQTGAHDGFHEAIGDTIQLSLTPAYLNKIGLSGESRESKEAVLNAQMKQALEKIAFLPFGKLIDEWRWGVFDGSIKPDNYNTAWWTLRRQYQGVAPVVPRNEGDFDPGAKYHVPANTPYMRYFLAHILQFQFQRSLCQAAGHKGPLHECSIYGNKEAGARYWAMLQKGTSQNWQATLKELTGKGEMDASAILDYFAPLHSWLKQQNKGRRCGWEGA
ncbi:M2 family metallopeptidase [Tahibacter amnicola]|uniref:M2 family metallopeptidase n=1 Tax=Tahibacter amnicola TaxID=2976241 RepID=A0ABY6BL11_9GAMM|nr:M2 family metallopeptidase [Tahibacter amnicola]UXI70713.1 M2 family metallopeptidase [Tahibacter amnicola]